MAGNQLVVVLKRLRTSPRMARRFSTCASVALLEHRVGEERLARGRAGHGHELVAQVHELQVEVLARRRAGVGAEAEALLADIALRVGADDVHQEQVLAALLVVEVAELAAQVEAVQVPDAGHVAGADAEDGALAVPGRSARSGCRRCSAAPSAAARCAAGRNAWAGNTGFGRCIWIWSRFSSVTGSKHVSRPRPAERRDDLVALLAEQVHDLQHVRALQDAGLHAASFATRTGMSWTPFSVEPRICCCTWRTK